MSETSKPIYRDYTPDPTPDSTLLRVAQLIAEWMEFAPLEIRTEMAEAQHDLCIVAPHVADMRRELDSIFTSAWTADREGRVVRRFPILSVLDGGKSWS